MVTDVLEHRLIVIFIEGLSKPLRGWVKAFKPFSLQDSIISTCNMEDAIPKNFFSSKTFLPQKNKDNKSFQKEWSGKDKMVGEMRIVKKEEAMFQL
jgi:hypothetical protein